MTSTPSRIGAIILAAGASTRMGQAKQLLCFRGETLVRRAVKIAFAAGCDPVMVVIGARGELVNAELADCGARFIENTQWITGLAGSIRTGILAMAEDFPDVEAVVLMTCDQPLISAEHIQALTRVFQKTLCAIVASKYGGSLGVPALFDRSYFPSLLALERTQGAKHLILSRAEDVASVNLPEAAFDIDTASDYERLTRSTRSGDETASAK